MTRRIVRLLCPVQLMLLFSITFAQGQAIDLKEAVASGSVEIVELRGNGSSSGAAIDGTVRNTTSQLLRIRTAISVPLYLANRGPSSRQNMIATQIYGEDGGFFVEGEQSFIELPSNSSTRIMLVAYCADFEKDNPESSDSFLVRELPPDLVEVARRIANFEAPQVGRDRPIASQMALWLAQGLSADQIREKFPVSAEDERVARRILADN